MNIELIKQAVLEAQRFIDDDPKYAPEDIKIANGYDLDELAKEYKLRDRCDGETDKEYRAQCRKCNSVLEFTKNEWINSNGIETSHF